MVGQWRFTGVVVLHLTNVGERPRVYISALPHLEGIEHIAWFVVGRKVDKCHFSCLVMRHI